MNRQRYQYFDTTLAREGRSAMHNQTKSKFTPTETKILKMLSDGMPHTKHELQACLTDEQVGVDIVATHIASIRKKLPPNQLITNEYKQLKWYYRMVEKLRSGNSE